MTNFVYRIEYFFYHLGIAKCNNSPGVDTMSLFNVGKPYRTKLGKYLDNKGISATWLAKKSGVNRNTINSLLNKKDNYSPNLSTIKKVMKVINHELDKGKKSSDFFDI